MAFDFPNTPTVGQAYQGYVYDGEKWVAQSITVGAVRYDSAQGLTSAQMSQARANIAVTKRNYVINGGMQISQENGATVLTGSSAFPVDGFFGVFVNGGATSMAQVASITPGGSSNRLRYIATAADAAVAAGDYAYIGHRIEGLRVADLLFGTATAKAITVQFGVKAPAGTYCIVVMNGALARAYVAEYTVAAGEANTDVVKSVTLTGDITGTWAKDNTTGMEIRWGLMAGSTSQLAAGSWGTGTNVITGSSSQFNLMGTINNTFELFDVSLTEGTVAPPFQLPDLASELALCTRYYEQGGQTITYYAGAGIAGITTAYGNIPFLVAKRAAPTVSVTAGFPFRYYSTTDVVNDITPTFIAATSGFTYSASGMTNYKAWHNNGQWKANARL